MSMNDVANFAYGQAVGNLINSAFDERDAALRKKKSQNQYDKLVAEWNGLVDSYKALRKDRDKWRAGKIGESAWGHGAVTGASYAALMLQRIAAESEVELTPERFEELWAEVADDRFRKSGASLAERNDWLIDNAIDEAHLFQENPERSLKSMNNGTAHIKEHLKSLLFEDRTIPAKPQK